MKSVAFYFDKISSFIFAGILSLIFLAFIVTFVNQSSRAMWIASNPHPIHTGLAGFDAKKGIGNGESFSFSFTKAGEFGYHNHLNLSDTGTVVVE